MNRQIERMDTLLICAFVGALLIGALGARHVERQRRLAWAACEARQGVPVYQGPGREIRCVPRSK